MKKIVVFLWLIVFSLASFGQKTDSTTTIAKPDYMRKSNNQKVLAWVLTGGAVAIFVGAVVHDVNNLFTDESAGTGWYIASAAMLGGGITLFIASSKNRKKANDLSFFMNLENVPTLQGAVVANHPVPSIGLSIKLKRFGFKF